MGKIKNINIMVVKCVSFLDKDQINIIPETYSKPTMNKGLTSFDQFQINLELNEFKENEMNVHPESLENNHYFNYKGTIEAEARSLKSRQEKESYLCAWEARDLNQL